MIISSEFFTVAISISAVIVGILAVGITVWAIAQRAAARELAKNDEQARLRKERARARRRAISILDDPIRSKSEDVLGRADVAHDFAHSLRLLDVSQGLVVGVLGPWGAGKSSFVNLMRESFQSKPKFTVIDFNPWMYSGTQQLVDVFFKEVAAALRLKSQSRFGQIADALDEYGEVLSPIALVPAIGGWWDRTFRAYKSARKWWKERSAQPLRLEIAAALDQLAQPVVVVIDDIDRLTKPEIRDIFKLVRLTASFPNVIYLLSFDRRRVEHALAEGDISGRDYLAKIVQLGFDLPAIPREAFRAQILARLNLLLDGVAEVRFDEERWPDVYVEIVEPLLLTMRDVTRFALSARPTVTTLGSDIETVDLLALEAIRVFRPELFASLQAARDALTEVSSDYGSRANETHKAQVEHLLALEPTDATLVKSLIHRVFPAARRYVENHHYGGDFERVWRTKRQLAHIDFLNHYLDRTAPSGVASLRRAEIAYSLLRDGLALDSYMRSMNPDDLEDTISGLEAYQTSFTREQVVPGSSVLLNLIPAIPNRDPRGMFDIIRRDMVVIRVVLRLFRSIEDVGERSALAHAVLDHVVAYSGKLAFLRVLGSSRNDEAGLVPADTLNAWTDSELDELLRAGPDRPEEEWDLTRVMAQAIERDGAVLRRTIDSVAEIRSIFQSARSVGQSQSMDSRHVQIEEHLWWDGLVLIFGDDAGIRRAVSRLRESEGSTPIVLLVEKYLDGWRPREWPGDD